MTLSDFSIEPPSFQLGEVVVLVPPPPARVDTNRDGAFRKKPDSAYLVLSRLT
jgi:hypothetical protein